MKKPISKKEIRVELEEQMQDFLAGGGAVDDIPRGISGRNPGDPPVKPKSEFFEKSAETRTYVPEIIAALEERKKKPAPPKKRVKKPRKVMLYDDFGEPLRWIWKDE
jgi:hypothetical protein